MSRRGGGESLAERLARSAPAPAAERAEDVLVPSPRPAGVHCWVDHHMPGLLIEWRRDDLGWFGRVTYIVEGRLVEEWLPSSRLRAAIT